MEKSRLLLFVVIAIVLLALAAGHAYISDSAKAPGIQEQPVMEPHMPEVPAL